MGNWSALRVRIRWAPSVAYDEEMANAKRRELCELIEGSFEHLPTADSERLAAEVAGQFANVTPPYSEPLRVEMVTLRPGGRGGGTSAKPGNVVLNFRKLVVAIGSGVLTVAGTMAVPWTLLIGALLTWERLWSSAEIAITEEQACVLWSIWQTRDERNTVSKADVAAAVNRERSEFGKQPLNPREVETALEDLIGLGCIRQSRDPARWRLREWVRVKY